MTDAAAVGSWSWTKLSKVLLQRQTGFNRDWFCAFVSGIGELP